MGGPISALHRDMGQVRAIEAVVSLIIIFSALAIISLYLLTPVSIVTFETADLERLGLTTLHPKLGTIIVPVASM